MDTATSKHPPCVSSAGLMARLGRADAPLIIDVRKPSAYDAAERVIAGALRIAPGDLKAAAGSLSRERPIVVYCVHGHEVSQGAASDLNDAGIHAAYLEGGIAHWQAERLPTMVRLPELGLPAKPGVPSRWITRERPKIDRIACPWLIRRFVDSTARFLYVPPGEVIATAKREGAIAYDVPDVRFSHRDQDGERCSFDSFVADLQLDDPCLGELAAIVRGADTGRPELTPQSAGLLAISRGLSVNFADDQAMLEQGMVVYDALYAWLRSVRPETRNAAFVRKAQP